MQVVMLYSGIMGLLLILLSYSVAAKRKKFKVGIGDGDNHALSKAIRVQANFIEYVPFAIILMFIYESNQGSFVISHVAGGLLLFARLLHAYGLGKTKGTSVGRLVGTLLTWIVILGLALLNIYLYFSF